jgi:hypothetical protein
MIQRWLINPLKMLEKLDIGNHNNKSKNAKVKVNFSLEQAMKAQRGSRGIALLFL